VGDGKPDTLVKLKRNVSINDMQDDFDAAARRAELVDTTGDGLPDTLAIDTNDDGRHDTMIKLEHAADGAGSQDIMQRIKLVDTVGDGRPDSFAVDTVGDGVADVHVKLQGRESSAADVERIVRRASLVDTSGDGLPDTLAVDTVGDGVPDTLVQLQKLNSSPQLAATLAPTPPPSPPSDVALPSQWLEVEKDDASDAPGGISPALRLAAGEMTAHSRWSLMRAAPASPKRVSISSPSGSNDRLDRWPSRAELPPSQLSATSVTTTQAKSHQQSQPAAAASGETPTSWQLHAGSAPVVLPTDGTAGGSAEKPKESTSLSGFFRWRLGSPMMTASKAASLPTHEEASATPDSPSLASVPNLDDDLEAFAAKHGLTHEASQQLKELYYGSLRKVSKQLNVVNTGPTYRWDQLNEMIVSHSPGTSLVIINLPDPPDILETATVAERMTELLDYMNYMEGMAKNLPRVLYVHGSGQEVINLTNRVE